VETTAKNEHMRPWPVLLRRNQRIWPLELLDATQILLTQSQQHLISPAEELGEEVLQQGQLLLRQNQG
jgi:hypothetical protein